MKREMEWKWSVNEVKMKWGNGVGMEREMEWKWNGNGVGMEME
jgi:hypothetical protein